VTLFQTGDFTLASGQKSTWKIECDALTPEDWAGLAAMAVQFLPPFGAVLGVPRGGLPLARALEKYVTSGSTLVVDELVDP
jgi:orotate phosphoribosyltransferase